MGAQEEYGDDWLGRFVMLPLTDMWRNQSGQVFEFGDQEPYVNERGLTDTMGTHQLVASGRWVLELPDGRLLLGERFDPDGPSPLDAEAAEFLTLVATQAPSVTSLAMEPGGNLTVHLSSGHVVRIFALSEAERDAEDWSTPDWSAMEYGGGYVELFRGNLNFDPNFDRPL